MRRSSINPDSLDLEERVISLNKCQKTHKGGRTLSWSALVVVGDRRGHVGVAVGKARGIADAIRKGMETARRCLIRAPLSGTTIPHPLTVQYGAAKVLFKPASEGTGVVAGGAVRAILEAVGVRDVLTKSLGSSNPINNAWATMKALQSLDTPEMVAARRGVPVETLLPRRSRTVMSANGDSEEVAAEVAEAAEETADAGENQDNAN